MNSWNKPVRIRILYKYEDKIYEIIIIHQEHSLPTSASLNKSPIEWEEKEKVRREGKEGRDLTNPFHIIID